MDGGLRGPQSGSHSLDLSSADQKDPLSLPRTFLLMNNGSILKGGKVIKIECPQLALKSMCGDSFHQMVST